MSRFSIARTRWTAVLVLTALGGCASDGAVRGSTAANTAAAANMQLGSAYLQQGNLPVAKEKLERAVSRVRAIRPSTGCWRCCTSGSVMTSGSTANFAPR